MKNFINMLTVGAGALLLLPACSTSYNAMRGENDDLYFQASDARIATEYAVSNNNAQNFQSLNNVDSRSFEQENFSARNVNPEYIARYQNQTSGTDEGAVYFDDANAENTPNINIYNNYSVGNNGWNNRGMNNSMFNLGFGMGMGMGMSPFWGMPMGMGWGMPMMGFYDPFWGMPGWGMGFHDPFWGMPMWGMRPGFGWNMGWNSMWGFNMGFGWGGRGMWGMNPWMNPMMGGFYGWNRPVFIVNNNYGENSRRVVRGATPTRGSMSSPSMGSREGNILPSNSRAARRDATTSSGRTGTSANSRTSARDFSSSQNDYYNTGSRIGNSTSGTSSRNTSSAAATRPTRSGGVNSVNPANTRVNTPYNNANRGTAPSYSNRTAAPSNNRAVNPSYNRTNTNMGTPSRTMQSSPSRSGMSSYPNTRTSSPSMSTPSRSGGSSMGTSGGGGMSRGGGGGSSAGGSRGGRGN